MSKKIKATCLVSHELPLGAGKFKVYTVDKVYTISEGGYDPLLFAKLVAEPKKNKEVKYDDSCE